MSMHLGSIFKKYMTKLLQCTFLAQKRELTFLILQQPAPSQNKLFDSEESTRVVEKSLKS